MKQSVYHIDPVSHLDKLYAFPSQYNNGILSSSLSSRQIKNKIFPSPAVVVWLEIFLCGFGLQAVPVF